MNREQFLDGFEFHDETTWEVQIHDEIITQRNAFVEQWQSGQRLNSTTPQTKLFFHTLLINGFQEPWPHDLVHFDRSTDDYFG